MNQPDSLEAALRAVPLRHGKRCQISKVPASRMCTCAPRPDYPALVAAVRRWIKREMPNGFGAPNGGDAMERAYDAALADVARRLGV